MKRKSEYYPPFKDEGEVIVSWGEARLVKFLGGKYELRGETNDAWLAAKEGTSVFWHEAVVGDGSGEPPREQFSVAPGSLLSTLLPRHL